jgi:hypothetical protein
MPKAGAGPVARNGDRPLAERGRMLQDRDDASPLEGVDVAVCEFSLRGDLADFLPYIDSAPAGAIAARRFVHTLSGVESQSDKYSRLLPPRRWAYRRVLPFGSGATPVLGRCLSSLDEASSHRLRAAYSHAFAYQADIRMGSKSLIPERCSCGSEVSPSRKEVAMRSSMS